MTKRIERGTDALAILPEIREMIEAARHHVVSTANLTLVWLYWNIGRVITQDIQKKHKRARYGEEFLAKLGGHLTQEYGSGFSGRNLSDMRRFFLCFEILPPAAAEFSAFGILPPLVAESKPTITLSQSSDETDRRLPIEISKHRRLGWTHYRILLSVQDHIKRP